VATTHRDSRGRGSVAVSTCACVTGSAKGDRGRGRRGKRGVEAMRRGNTRTQGATKKQDSFESPSTRSFFIDYEENKQGTAAIVTNCTTPPSTRLLPCDVRSLTVNVAFLSILLLPSARVVPL
jgi:hypothetical protein